ncbi:MAG: peptide chain release factor N(5)-glutamine methyltransferase [Calditrichia bacterium]
MPMPEVWTVERILNWTVEHFTLKKIPEPRLSAELLLADVLQCSRVALYIQYERILSAGERRKFRGFVQRRLKREPVQYILGKTEFYGLPFRVTPAVLIPRPETELLVDAVLEYFKQEEYISPRILDIGTGSGCIAISLAKNLPDADIRANEKSTEALQIARQNAELNDVRIRFDEGDIFTLYGNLSGRFDVVVSNPPYVAMGERDSLAPELINYEPHPALFSGEIGLEFYEGLLKILPDLLNENGRVFLEAGYNTAGAVKELYHNEKYTVRVKKDYNQIDRILIIER